MLSDKPGHAEALAQPCVFSDSTPLVIYAAAYEGIRLLEVDGSRTNYTSPIQTATSASRITTLYSKDEIVFQNYVGGDVSKYVHYLNV